MITTSLIFINGAIDKVHNYDSISEQFQKIQEEKEMEFGTFTCPLEALFAIFAVWLVVLIVVWMCGRGSGVNSEYERIAGKILETGNKPVPKRIQRKLWKLIAIQPFFYGFRASNLLFCESVIATGIPEFICIEALSNQRFPEEDETFNISETGELIFNLQPDI